MSAGAYLNAADAAHGHRPLRFANRLWVERWQRGFDDFWRDRIRRRRRGMWSLRQWHGVGEGRGYVGFHHEDLSWLGELMFWMTFRTHSLRATYQCPALHPLR